jgi:hypothetical protein
MSDKLNSFRKDRLLLAKNYALYYGYGKGKELSLFDIAIVDPKGLTIQELGRLKLSNTLIITYLSLLEVHPTEPIFQELSSEDFLLIDGKPLKNDAFGTYLVNLQSKKWINYLLKKINYHFNVLESDGLFIDTIGDLELNLIPFPLKEQQLNAALNFLSVVRLVYPHHLLIQNNGLEFVSSKTVSLIDGIFWENPPFTLPESQEWVEVIIRQLSMYKDQHNLKIFLLLEETIEKERKSYLQARKIAKKHDFLLYYASENYVEGVNMIKG